MYEWILACLMVMGLIACGESEPKRRQQTTSASQDGDQKPERSKPNDKDNDSGDTDGGDDDEDFGSDGDGDEDDPNEGPSLTGCGNYGQKMSGNAYATVPTETPLGTIDVTIDSQLSADVSTKGANFNINLAYSNLQVSPAAAQGQVEDILKAATAPRVGKIVDSSCDGALAISEQTVKTDNGDFVWTYDPPMPIYVLPSAKEASAAFASKSVAIKATVKESQSEDLAVGSSYNFTARLTSAGANTYKIAYEGDAQTLFDAGVDFKALTYQIGEGKVASWTLTLDGGDQDIPVEVK